MAEVYRICVRGEIDQGWASYFDGLMLRPQADGTTMLCGPIADQAALHGHLLRLGRLGLPILLVENLEARYARRG